nr:hypothetical protein [Tanacetum cinerariifolium]
PHQPPPPPPPAGPSGASRAPGASGSSQVVPPPPPPSSTNQDSHSKGSVAPSSSKIAASVEYQAWTTTNVRLRHRECPYSQGKLKARLVEPLEEERPATPELAWSISSSDVPVLTNNWASALASNYSPPPEDSLLMQTDDIATFMVWFYFQLRIESYQTQLNLTKPQWNATNFEYKHDYTIINSSRAVMFQDKYRVQMMMRFNEIHKFSDGTLQRIDEAIDYRVKEFRINRMNPGLNTRFRTRKDVDQSKAFMFAIQKRLKTKRIFRNLESFVGGRVRDGDLYL